MLVLVAPSFNYQVKGFGVGGTDLLIVEGTIFGSVMEGKLFVKLPEVGREGLFLLSSPPSYLLSFSTLAPLP